MARKNSKPSLDEDEDFLEPDEEESNEASAAMLDPLFEKYRTPELEDEEFDDDDGKSFIEDVAEESAHLMQDLQAADKQQISVLNKTAKAVGSGVDVNYFFCVVFVSEEQKLSFLEQTGWNQFGGVRYLNGIEIAKAMELELPPGYLATDANPNKSLAPLTPSGGAANKNSSKSKTKRG